MPVTRPGGFDVAAFFAALDERRTSAGLSWAALAAEVWDQSWLLNFRRGGHPIAQPQVVLGAEEHLGDREVGTGTALVDEEAHVRVEVR